MKRVKCLGRYQKNVLFVLMALVLIFSIIYPITIARKGVEYQNTILVPNQENGQTMYSGKIQGKQACFTVSADQTVAFQYGDQTYGPYTVKEDPTAIPKDHEMGDDMTGIEIDNGAEVLFRGGILEHGDERYLFHEDGSLENIHISVTTNNGIVMDESGEVIDPMEPTASTIVDLTAGPDLTHKGTWFAWFCGVFVCILAGISILFADELFRWQLAFRIRNTEQAEPSDWELASRYITWTGLAIMALIIFVQGLQ